MKRWNSIFSLPPSLHRYLGPLPALPSMPKPHNIIDRLHATIESSSAAKTPIPRPACLLPPSDSNSSTASMACVGKGLIFKHKTRSPAELIHRTHDLLLNLLYANNTTVAETRDRKREDKLAEVGKLLLEMRNILYGDGEVEPNPDACLQVTKEFFSKSTFRLLIQCLPKLDLGTRQNATHVLANLQRQKVNSRLIASDYLEANLDLMDILIPGYEDGDIAITFGAIARECMRHQVVAKYVLESGHMNKFFDYLQTQNFEIASDVQATYKELLTRHKSTVAEFLSSKYDWFFPEYNIQLLESTCYIIKRHAIELLGAMLLDRSNTGVMLRYVSSADNLRIMMNLLRDSNKTIKLEAFHVFKLFVANENKPHEIILILVTNKTKLLRFLEDFKIEKEDAKFLEDKHLVIQEIATLNLPDRPRPD